MVIIAMVILLIIKYTTSEKKENRVNTETTLISDELKWVFREFEDEFEEAQEKKDAEPVIKEVKKLAYRLTSYWTGDNTNSGTMTGSGLSTKNFQVNEKGWYTYKGRLVLAGATNECLRVKSGRDGCSRYTVRQDGIYYFTYHEEVLIEIDGISYEGVVLDSCGACMRLQPSDNGAGRLDVFVANKSSKIDRGYKGRSPVYIIK